MQGHEDFDDPSADVLWTFKAALAFALVAVALSAGAGIYLSDSEGAAVTAELVAEAHRKQCPIEIAQFGPGERWRNHHQVYACATAAREVPAHILSYPVGE